MFKNVDRFHGWFLQYAILKRVVDRIITLATEKIKSISLRRQHQSAG